MGISTKPDITNLNKVIQRYDIRPSRSARDVTAVRRSITQLWRPFTMRICDQLRSEDCHSLALEARNTTALTLGINDQWLGEVKDPLKIAPAMTARGLEQVAFFPDSRGNVLDWTVEKTLLAILTGGFMEIRVGKGKVYCLDDIFVDEAIKGLPVMDGVAYKFADSDVGIPDNNAAKLEAFSRNARTSSSADWILREARQLMQQHSDDVRNILSARAGLFAGVNYSSNRDVPSAIKIWEFLTAANPYNIVRVQIHLARKLFPADGLRDNRNFDDALMVWNSAHGIASSNDGLRGEVENIYREIQKLARALSSMFPHANKRDLDAAIKINEMVRGWDREAGESVLRIIKNAPSAFFRRFEIISKEDVLEAIRTWSAVYKVMDDGNEKRSFMDKAVLMLPGRVFYGMEVSKQILDDPAIDKCFGSVCVSHLYYGARRFEDAIAVIDKICGEYPVALQIKADCLRKLKRYSDAIELLTQIIYRSDDEYAKVHAFCCGGYCRLMTGNDNATVLNEAIRDFDKSIGLAQKIGVSIPPRAYSGKGFAYRELGEEEKARAEFLHALELDPNNIKAKKALGLIKSE